MGKKDYTVHIPMYHGTSKENAEAIIKKGYSELFVTNKRSRAFTYGDYIVFFWMRFEFNSLEEKQAFENRLNNGDDFIDCLIVDNETRALFWRAKNEKPIIKVDERIDSLE